MPVRVIAIFRPLVVAVALSVPLAQAVLAGQGEQPPITNYAGAAVSFLGGGGPSQQQVAHVGGQAEQPTMMNHMGDAESFLNGGPYSDQQLAPAVGN